MKHTAGINREVLSYTDVSCTSFLLCGMAATKTNVVSETFDLEMDKDFRGSPSRIRNIKSFE